MKNAYVNLVLAAVAAAPALAQQAAWAQCGGSGWTGSTACVSGYTCKSSNEYYSQCVPGSSSDSGSGTAPSTGDTGSGSADAAPWWVGINLSGAEFGDGKYPGIYNKDYTWYSNSAIDQFISKGFNLFRINFSMERLTPTITGSFDAGYLGNLTATVNYITGKGAYAMIQPHNYGRFNGAIITDTNAFKTWWQNVASQYKSNNLVVFDTNNEYHDMDQSLVVNLNQAAINGIRAAGATSQWITPEGNSWTGAWTWTSVNGATMGALTDPQNKLIYQMHQYLDTDGSGTHAECVSTTIFQERLTSATQWLKQNSKKGFIGEFAGGNNTQCITALNQGLQYLKANKDVWTGSAWWAAGPWWGDYMYSMEPPTGTAWSVVLPKIQANLK